MRARRLLEDNGALAIEQHDVAVGTEAAKVDVGRTGVQAVAVLEAEAAEVLKHMGAKDVQKVGQAMATLTNVSRERATDVLESFVLERDTAVPGLALILLLEALAEHCGPRLLRVKGLVRLEEMPDRPALIHGVQHVFAAPEFLPRWPGDDGGVIGS